MNGDNAYDDLSDRFLNGSNNIELKYFVRNHCKQTRGREGMPIRIMTLSESKSLYPDVPHSWLCDGKLLRLLDSDHPGNYLIFQVSRWFTMRCFGNNKLGSGCPAVEVAS